MSFQKGQLLTADALNKATGRVTGPGQVSIGGDTYQRRLGGSGTEGAGVHSAYCKVDAGTGNTIVCYLDVDTSGEEITVECEICGGTALNAAFPRLEDGDRLFVFQDGATWRALQIFQATEEC